MNDSFETAYTRSSPPHFLLSPMDSSWKIKSIEKRNRYCKFESWKGTRFTRYHSRNLWIHEYRRVFKSYQSLLLGSISSSRVSTPFPPYLHHRSFPRTWEAGSWWRVRVKLGIGWVRVEVRNYNWRLCWELLRSEFFPLSHSFSCSRFCGRKRDPKGRYWWLSVGWMQRYRIDPCLRKKWRREE